jgi:hypothetical protein
VPHCTGCGRPVAECDRACARPSDPWHYCPDCGGWLAVQVTPTGWAGTCRACGTTHQGHSLGG